MEIIKNSDKLNQSLVEQQITEKVEELKDRLIRDVREMVKIDSVETPASGDAPYGEGVKNALLKALEIGDSMGFQIKNLDNQIGYVQYGEGDDYVCAIGHVDVVPVGDGWKYPPFSGHMEDGVLYGRGVLDNKGPILSCLYGLYACKELGIHPKLPVRIIFGCDEESGFEDLHYYLKKEKPPVYGFTPDCKYPVVYSERGRAIVKISASVDQIQPFFELVNQYFIGAKNNGDRLGIDYFNQEYGTLEMRNYTLSSNESHVSFSVTLSYPVGITISEILEKIRQKAEDFTVELAHNYDPVVFEKNCDMVRAMQKAYELVTGMDGTPVTTTGGTYAKAMPGIVPFGPSFPGQKGISHNPNEWMTEKDLITNGKIYALALYYLSQMSV